MKCAMKKNKAGKSKTKCELNGEDPFLHKLAKNGLSNKAKKVIRPEESEGTI